MLEIKKLPYYFVTKEMTSPHDIALFGQNTYVNLHPFALYRINGEEISVCRNMRSEYIRSFDFGTESGAIEIYNHNSKQFMSIFSDEDYYEFKVEITLSTLRYMESKYGELFFIDYDDYRGWAGFNINDKLGMEVKVDLNRATIEFKNGKKHKIDTIKEHYSDVDDNQQHMVFTCTAYYDEFVRNLTKEVESKELVKDYDKIYQGVKDGSIQFDEFIKMV